MLLLFCGDEHTLNSAEKLGVRTLSLASFSKTLSVPMCTDPDETD